MRIKDIIERINFLLVSFKLLNELKVNPIGRSWKSVIFIVL
jgi:hypothetical protein